MSFHFVRNPYPEETLYSIAARTRRAIAYSSAMTFVRHFLGLTRLSLGLGLTNFRQNFGHDAIAHQPLHLITSFLVPPKKRSDVWDAVRAGSVSRVAYLLGAPGHHRLVGEYLRYCPKCAKEQRGKVGEAYWTRLPQIEGVPCCPLDGSTLVTTSVSRRHPGDLHTLESWLRCQSVQGEPVQASKVQVLLATQIARLLSFEPSWDSFRLNESWRGLLGEVSIAPHARGAAKRVQCGLIDLYGEKYLSSAGCAISPFPECSWVAKFLRNPAKDADPLHHLLILTWLGKDLDDLVARSPLNIFNPAGVDQDSVKCGNRLCPKHGTASITHTRAYRDRRTREKKAQFTCGTCGATIERVLVQNDRPDRVIDRGDLWRSRLGKWWGDSSKSLRELGRLLDGDPMTIKREAVRAGLQFPRLSLRPTRDVPVVGRQARDIEGERQKRRDVWLIAVKAASGTKAARALEPAVYAWLYRHDREWLCDHSPAKVPVVASSRVDWIEKEKIFLGRLELAYLRIINQEPFTRCSLTALARGIGAEGQLKHFDKMPKLRGEFDYLVEDEGRFALRRIAAIAQAHRGQRLTPDQLRRKAGIRYEVAQNPAVAQFLRDQLAK